MNDVEFNNWTIWKIPNDKLLTVPLWVGAVEFIHGNSTPVVEVD